MAFYEKQGLIEHMKNKLTDLMPQLHYIMIS